MADTKVSDLPLADTLTGAELLLLSQDGADAQTDLDTVKAWIAPADANGWVRPADWLPMPATAANQIDILAAVTDDDSNYVALSATVTGGYTVDWGDGTAENVSSGTTAYHQYDYSDSDLDGTLSARGYKQALIKITPQGANDITAFNLGLKHNASGLGSYSNPWLDIQVNAPSATSMTYRGGVEARLVERIDLIAIGAVTTLLNAFASCSSLQSITFPTGSLGSVTTLAGAFVGCSSLQSITFPTGSLGSVTTLANAFQGCSSLQSITFPTGSLGSVTILTSTFLNCSALQSITFPTGSLGSVDTTTTTFSGCGSLARIINCAIPVSFSVASCKLSAAALDEIYTALPSVTATITVTGNVGTSGDDETIATGKGWTVTT